jgi:pyrroloquinoline quinone biosynthesis protein B
VKRTFLLLFLIVLFALGAANNPGTTHIVVLGIAQDGGIPQIGCTQKICRTQHHLVSSLAILSGSSMYLIDATPDLREQYAGTIQRYPAFAKPNLFDGIFLTHAHMGHYTGLMYLGKESISTKKTPVFASSEMSDFLTKNAPWSLLFSNQNIDLHPFESGKEIAIEGAAITPVLVPHRHEFTDTHGFLIRGPHKTLLYISDIDSWEPIRDQLRQWLKQADYALLDGTFYSGDELPGRNIKLVPHPTVVDSMALFQSWMPIHSQIWFTHLNHTNPLLDKDSTESKSFAKTPFGIVSEWQEFEL